MHNIDRYDQMTNMDVKYRIRGDMEKRCTQMKDNLKTMYGHF